LGGVIVMMLWFFLTGLSLVIGGEISAMYHRHKTKKPDHKMKDNDRDNSNGKSDAEAYRTLSIK
jgi:membrane protein